MCRHTPKYWIQRLFWLFIEAKKSQTLWLKITSIIYFDHGFTFGTNLNLYFIHQLWQRNWEMKGPFLRSFVYSAVRLVVAVSLELSWFWRAEILVPFYVGVFVSRGLLHSTVAGLKKKKEFLQKERAIGSEVTCNHFCHTSIAEALTKTSPGSSWKNKLQFWIGK